ncbi:vacuolar protein sorting-associated protein 37A isoform X2 [Daktulosphaira vitifoliae]|uniref:vacuolar protein sorting-associated protein 37A isoform X2 n=1 Tax=Daktulosphaira vitifoliae TaxID=58002 RepID=UPI0021AAA2D3|nr:vacuolar protein sorting-associated protein 37A isoform X2 [Daktulosphaira vitifoliae]
MLSPNPYCPLSSKREKQIDTLKVFNENVTEINPGKEYSVEFNTKAGKLRFLIELSADFPLNKPEITVSPCIIHKWVDNSGKIYSIHSDLGRVVQVIRREFELDQSLELANNTNSFSVISSFLNDTVTTLSNDMEFRSLTNLTSAELLRLNSDVDCLDEFISELPSIEASNKAIENTITKVMDLANSNISKEKPIDILKLEISKQLEKIELSQKSYSELTIKYAKLSEKYLPKSISNNLKEAALKCDEESERIAEQFLSGKMDCDMFLQIYLNSRTLSYTRKAKEERLSYQLKQLKDAGF